VTVRDDLAQAMGPVFFSDLRAHLTRDVVIVIDRALDLLDVAVAVANDDKTFISAQVNAGRIRKPSEEDLARWATIADARWDSVVVAPFVIVRERADAAAH